MNKENSKNVEENGTDFGITLKYLNKTACKSHVILEGFKENVKFSTTTIPVSLTPNIQMFNLTWKLD